MSDNDKKWPLYPNEIVDPRTVPFSSAKSRGYLPHLYKDGCTYFVTFCLADVTKDRHLVRRILAGEEDPNAIAESFEPRPVAGKCILREARTARIVEDSLLHFQGERYALSAWCVMPNHVHVVMTPNDGHPLRRILHSWKSYTAHEINRQIGNSGPVWQEESFDHAVRDQDSFQKFLTYTEMNPVSAGFVDRPERWPFSSARFRISVQEDT